MSLATNRPVTLSSGPLPTQSPLYGKQSTQYSTSTSSRSIRSGRQQREFYGQNEPLQSTAATRSQSFCSRPNQPPFQHRSNSNWTLATKRPASPWYKPNTGIFAAELTHRGQAICNALAKRRALRRNRRSRRPRYRQSRFNNRTRSQGWLAPSLWSHVDNIQTWFTKLLKLAPITAISMELVRFDTQLLENAEITGVEYQQGELTGYEVREYLLEKFNRTCAYCGVQNLPLEVEHITPKTRGGSNRVSNLTLACHACNQAKGSQTATEFGHPDVQAKAKQLLKDTAAVNATRWAIWRRLNATGLPIEIRHRRPHQIQSLPA